MPDAPQKTIDDLTSRPLRARQFATTVAFALRRSLSCVACEAKRDPQWAERQACAETLKGGWL